MGHVGARLAEGQDVILDERLLGVGEAEVSQFGKRDALESGNPAEVTSIQLEPPQRGLIHMECVLDVHVGHVVQEVHMLDVTDHRHQLDDVDLIGVGVRLHLYDALPDDLVQFAVDQSEAHHFHGREHLVNHGQCLPITALFQRLVVDRPTT